MDRWTIEGTWEEITRRGDELAGCRVRLTVLIAPAPCSEMLDGALAVVLDSAEELSRSLPPLFAASDLDGFNECIVEKYRRQGFDL